MLKGIAGLSEDDILAKRGHRLREERRGLAAPARGRRLRRRLHPAPDPGRPGPGDLRKRREHAAEVDLLLPQGADRAGLQPGRLRPARRRIGPWSRSTPRRATTAPPRSGTAAAFPSTTGAPRPTASLDEACSQLGVARALCGAGRGRARRRHPPPPGRPLRRRRRAGDRARGGRAARRRDQPHHRGDGRLDGGADRPLHGPGRAAAQVRDPRRQPALRPARRRPHGRSAAPSAASPRSPRKASWPARP